MNKYIAISSILLWSAVGAAVAYQENGAPAILGVSDNREAYAGGQVPRYAKLEMRFQVETKAKNKFFPYDPAPPHGLEPGTGISCDAVFTAPDGNQYRQPAFFYQEFDHQVRSDRDWLYPTDMFLWKVRFSPHQAGVWKYRIMVQDAGGTAESAEYSFVVVESSSRGFVRVSGKDPRYFEFDDGTYFPALGYNADREQISWTNPVLDSKPNFEVMGENGIQLVRMWLSQWAVYGSAWNPWRSHVRNGYLPNESLALEEKHPESELAFKISYPDNPCILWGWGTYNLPVKRNTRYLVRIRYKTRGIDQPRKPGLPHGLVAKLSSWGWSRNDETKRCTEPGFGTVVTEYGRNNTDDWQWLEGSFESQDSDFLDYFYIALENVSSGTAYIDHVSICEELANGEPGPNIVSKPSADLHRYVDQRNAYAFDRVLDLAEANGVYLRLVVMEKMDWVFRHIDLEGNWIPNDPACWDGNPNNDPPKCPKGDRWFYGNGRKDHKVRWLQKAWWRYLQARWGYSPNIHSWELINEGHPGDKNHWILADEFGQFMHSEVFGVPVADGQRYTLDHPNDHLVSTSFWIQFPVPFFSSQSGEYDNVDFADIHRYLNPGEPGHGDLASETAQLGTELRGLLSKRGKPKPIVRGEVGVKGISRSRPRRRDPASENGRVRALPEEAAEGSESVGARIRLHNQIWAGINPSGMIDSYFFVSGHIYEKDRRSGRLLFDHRSEYGTYYRFVNTIPLNNGHYEDAQPHVTNSALRAWGQKDLVNGNAHLWIQNRNHTWKNIASGMDIVPQSGTVTLKGFIAGREYRVEWWDSWQGRVLRSETIKADAAGQIVLTIEALVSDVAIKVLSGPSGPSGRSGQ
ncbi:MAG TPA: DUF5060 domain-containing protein [Acidobacteriota bacterium]|nr:DUF5060 domain-containing protein [Acidobacteriota bacterium]